MLGKLKLGYRQFRDDDPGARFINLYRRWNEGGKGVLATIVALGLGLLLIIGGFVLAAVPGVPGIVLGVLGIAVIATRFPRLSMWLDWFELRCRKVWRKLRRQAAQR
jgi:hypothetical protein